MFQSAYHIVSLLLVLQGAANGQVRGMFDSSKVEAYDRDLQGRRGRGGDGGNGRGGDGGSGRGGGGGSGRGGGGGGGRGERGGGAQGGRGGGGQGAVNLNAARMNMNNNMNRNMNMGGGSSSRDSGDKNQETRTVTIEVTNLARAQPLSEFYIMAHNEKALPLYEVGEKATEAMGVLAEDGSGAELVILYTQFATEGVDGHSIQLQSNLMMPQGLGESLTFQVEVSDVYPLISFAAMATNTNDAFVGVSGMRFEESMTLLAPGYDAGTEANNELCNYIPGPACSANSTNLRAEEFAEGAVYIHSGIHGVSPDDSKTPTDLNPAQYDWRNPMVKIVVTV